MFKSATDLTLVDPVGCLLGPLLWRMLAIRNALELVLQGVELVLQTLSEA